MVGMLSLYKFELQVLTVPETLSAQEPGKAGFSWLTWFFGILSLILLRIIIYMYRHNGDQAPEPEADRPESPQKLPADMNDEELFRYLSDLIRDERLYLNPLLDRQSLISRLGLSAHRIGAAFSKGSEFHSLPGFVRSLRLEHACELLVSRPDLSVKSVGEMSGFSNNSTFCSDFKIQFGMTPSDYRQDKLSRNG